MQILHTIHALHQYAYLPILLFIVALLIVKTSIHSQNNARYLGYVIAVALLICCVFIM